VAERKKYYGNAEDLASVLGVNHSTVSRFSFPVHETKGRQNIFDIGQCVKLYIASLKPQESEEGQSHKDRLTKAQADKTELQVKKMRQELIPAEIVERQWATYILNCRNKLIVIPNSLAGQTRAEYAHDEKLIKDAILNALQELHEYDPSEYQLSDTEYLEESDPLLATAKDTERKRPVRPGKAAKSGDSSRARKVVKKKTTIRK
jgi:phage terminase Nu1 subunit (DNA packaging protein)